MAPLASFLTRNKGRKMTMLVGGLW
jgi:hypothetical protein